MNQIQPPRWGREKKKPQQGVGFNHPEEKKYFKSFLIKKPLGVERVYSASKGFRSTFLDPDSGPRPPQESSYITPTIPDAGPSSLRPELSPTPCIVPETKAGPKKNKHGKHPVAKLGLFTRPKPFRQPPSLSAFTFSVHPPALLQPHRLPCCPSSLPSILLPQGLCTAPAVMAPSLLPFRSRSNVLL